MLQHHHGHHHHHHDTEPEGSGGADKARDPVCGMAVTITDKARSRDYGSEKFFFCSDGCQEKFDADPWFYASGAASRVEKRAQPGTQYTCPMHPEIISDKPGSCPICGMALEPMVPG